MQGSYSQAEYLGSSGNGWLGTASVSPLSGVPAYLPRDDDGDDDHA